MQEAKETTNGWVRVEDGLPKVGDTAIVLVCGQYPALVEIEHAVSVPWLVEPIENGHKITHWQPFPAPPATDQPREGARPHPEQVGPQVNTRFEEFDDAEHPCNKWWEEHGQYMMSGGGRKEFIWACRGWIAREQLAAGVDVTGDSLNEAAAIEKEGD